MVVGSKRNEVIIKIRGFSLHLQGGGGRRLCGS